MPIYLLDDTQHIFPNPNNANEEGILAVGGDLDPQRLLLAYENGIFPWFNPEDPIIWWSPNPRMVLYPERVKVSKSMKQILNRNTFEIRYDTAFKEVMSNCQKVIRNNYEEAGSWITKDLIESYTKLHEMGYAHSVEAWQDNQLVGGLYGVSLGNCFFGESMFSKASNASKACFITLARELEKKNFSMIDCQVYTEHLESLGAEKVERTVFLEQLGEGLLKPTLKGSWTDLF